MNEPIPVARVCRVCGALFVPERPNFFTCSMACSTKRVEIVLDELARNLAGDEPICAGCEDPRSSHDVMPEGACRECSCIAFVAVSAASKP